MADAPVHGRLSFFELELPHLRYSIMQKITITHFSEWLSLFFAPKEFYCFYYSILPGWNLFCCQTYPCLKCLLLLLWEDCFPSHFSVFRIEHCPVELAVIRNLHCFSNCQYFCRPDKRVKHCFILIHQFHVTVIRCIACHDKQHWNSVVIVALYLGIISYILKTSLS